MRALESVLPGVVCPLITPFDGGAVDQAALRDHVAFLTDRGVDGLFPCGTTGEFASLDRAEWLAVVETTVDAAPGDVPVVAGAAATSVAETVERTALAGDAGADAAVVVPPYFHTANAAAGNRRFFEAVADDAALPLLLYNIPACTGRGIDVETVVAMADHDRVHGLKDSSGDLGYVLDVLGETPDDFLVLQGYDALLVPSLAMGADGGVSALSNVCPETCAAAVAADPDTARDLQIDVIGPLFRACVEHGFAPAAKAALCERGVLDDDAVRPPLVGVPDAERERLRELLAAADLV
ncbi:MAG: dihydrodipicolinate synthase family protein [Halobacteriaceae archaeon]